VCILAMQRPGVIACLSNESALYQKKKLGINIFFENMAKYREMRYGLQIYFLPCYEVNPMGGYSF
jgi:hypothetical protein